MKPKHHIPFILLNIPLLLLSPSVYAQDKDKDEIAIEATKTEETEAEKADSLLIKEAAEHAKEATKLAKKTAKLAEEAAKEAEKEPTKLAKENVKRAKKIAKEAAKRAKEATEKAESLIEKAQKVAVQPPAEKPETPSVPHKDKKPRNKDLAHEKKEKPEPVKRKVVEIPSTEPERLAESKVTEVTREVERDLDQRKTRIKGLKDAQSVINEILGAESRISRAEVAREERFRPRIERQHEGENRAPKASPDQRRAATTYYQQRLGGREVEGPVPEFFRQPSYRDIRRDPRVEERVVEQIEYVRPRYLNEGRRYVHYDTRSSIPAILMAALAMNQVRFQPTQEIAPIFYGRQDASVLHAMPLPPENYRDDNSWVVSYPVDEKSMISSEDILFLQGTTQFSDPYSYEIVSVMADAMKAMPVEERFVIEGHASAEGSYESNMILSQQRAEYIVREIVRRGVSPYRLLPVGYGESEAQYSEDAAEALLGQDRRVVVFRMKSEPIAQR